MMDYDAQFDPITGQDLPETVEKRQEEAIEKVQSEVVQIASLSEHMGWKYIVGLIQKDIEANVEIMLSTQHPDTLMRLQERVKTKRDFLQWLEIKVAERDYLVNEQKALAEAM